MIKSSTITKFARKSSITGQGINSGYYFKAFDFYCEDRNDARDKAIELGYTSLDDAFRDSAYTFEVWTVNEGEKFYDSKGVQYMPSGRKVAQNLFSAQGVEVPQMISQHFAFK